MQGSEEADLFKGCPRTAKNGLMTVKDLQRTVCLAPLWLLQKLIGCPLALGLGASK